MFSEARRRPHRVSEILAGILCALCTGGRRAGSAPSWGLLRDDAGAHSCDGGSGEVAAPGENACSITGSGNRSEARANFATRAGKPVLEKAQEKRICRVRGNRSAEGAVARPHLRTGGQSHG